MKSCSSKDSLMTDDTNEGDPTDSSSPVLHAKKFSNTSDSNQKVLIYKLTRVVVDFDFHSCHVVALCFCRFPQRNELYCSGWDP